MPLKGRVASDSFSGIWHAIFIAEIQCCQREETYANISSLWSQTKDLWADHIWCRALFNRGCLDGLPFRKGIRPNGFLAWARELWGYENSDISVVLKKLEFLKRLHHLFLLHWQNTWGKYLQAGIICVGLFMSDPSGVSWFHGWLFLIAVCTEGRKGCSLHSSQEAKIKWGRSRDKAHYSKTKYLRDLPLTGLPMPNSAICSMSSPS